MVTSLSRDQTTVLTGDGVRALARSAPAAEVDGRAASTTALVAEVCRTAGERIAVGRG